MMLSVTRSRWTLAAVVAALVLAVAGFAVLRWHPTAAQASTSTVVKFDVGGQTCYDPSCATNSASVPWGQYVRLTSGWSEIKSTGTLVFCRITDSGGKVLSYHTASTNGSWAFCSFTA